MQRNTLLERSFLIQQELNRRNNQQEALINKELARRKLIDFTTYTMPSYQATPGHVEYAAILDLFMQKKIKNLIISLGPQTGKLFSNNTPILTLHGWREHGDIKIGDFVFDHNGVLVKVLNVSKECFCNRKIFFEDNIMFYSHVNHEWPVIDLLDKKQKKITIGEMEKVDFWKRYTLIGRESSPFWEYSKDFKISKIEKINESHKGKCLEVEGGVYLIGEDLIPTCNSELSTRRLAAFALGQNPDLKIALASYNATFAHKFNKQIQRIMGSKEYNKLFPDTTIA